MLLARKLTHPPPVLGQGCGGRTVFYLKKPRWLSAPTSPRGARALPALLSMWVTVVGGGNSTPIFAALAKDAGHQVAILTRRPTEWNKDDVGFVNEDPDYMPQTELRVAIDLVTDDPALCIPQSDMIFIAGLPVHHNPTVLARIKPHLDMGKKVYIGSICAYGGFNCEHLLHRALGS